MASGAVVTALLWLVGVALVSAFIGYMMSRQLLAPLSSVRRDLEALPRTASRLASARLASDERDPPEIVAVRRAFNQLLEEIQREQSRRNAFLAALTHDLKTPLVAIGHLLGVVRDVGDLSREQRIEVVSRLSTENEALIELVQKMVDAYRLEEGEIPLARERVPLEEIVARAIERLRPAAAERGVAVRVRGGGEGFVDGKELERALSNLMANAIRYARSTLDMEIFPGMVRIADDGPGLPAPLEELAQPFKGKALEIAGRPYTAGSGGLGLFIARRILEAHGGRLVTEATGAGGTVLLAYVGEGG